MSFSLYSNDPHLFGRGLDSSFSLFSKQLPEFGGGQSSPPHMVNSDKVIEEIMRRAILISSSTVKTKQTPSRQVSIEPYSPYFDLKNLIGTKEKKQSEAEKTSTVLGLSPKYSNSDKGGLEVSLKASLKGYSIESSSPYFDYSHSNYYKKTVGI